MPINTRTESGEGDEAAIAELGVDMLLKMVFTDNYWHGDLHPGNILVKQTNQVPYKSLIFFVYF